MARSAIAAVALAALAMASSGCTGLQSWKTNVENAAAANACNDAGWTEETGRHQECITNTRTAWAQQQAQEQQDILVGGLAVAAVSGLYRQPTLTRGQQLRRAELYGSRFQGAQLICQYQTESGMVQVVGASGNCPAEYFY